MHPILRAVFTAVSGACPLRAIFACLGKIPLRLAFSRATMEGFAYEMCVKIKLSTGGFYFINRGCGQKSFKNFEEFLSCVSQENRLFKIFEKSLTNISTGSCSSICSINLHVISVFFLIVEFISIS